jgi:hypothetical protein
MKKVQVVKMKMERLKLVLGEYIYLDQVLHYKEMAVVGKFYGR